MGLLAIVYCIGLFTNFSIYGIPNKYSLTLFKGWSICCATGGQLRALRGVNLKRDEGVSLSVFSTSVTIEYQGTNNRFFCSGHGSTFTNTVTVSNGPAAQALKQYKTALTGNNLRVYA